MNSREVLEKFNKLKTPFYFYDAQLLASTLDCVAAESQKYGYKIHYALKANFNDRIIAEVRKRGFGIDCVSGGEVRKAIESGIPASEVVFAGVAKSDDEIIYGLNHDIFSFNCESREELEVINSIAAQMGKTANVAFRINPDIDPKTHKNISTGKADSKFGIAYDEVEQVIASLEKLKNVQIVGIHFHIGSQISDMSVFKNLCLRVNELQNWFDEQGFKISHVNVGGGLAINYEDPEGEPIPNFEEYFKVFADNLKLRADQTLHFELGRSIVGQCGELITRVFYNKTTSNGNKIVLIDAGMTDLIRPALYQAKHRIANLSSTAKNIETYTIAGPICESSDIFARDIELPQTQRGDILTIMSAGAYGRCMSSNYNLREFPTEIFSDDNF